MTCFVIINIPMFAVINIMSIKYYIWYFIFVKG